MNTPIATAAMIFGGISGAPQYGKNDVTYLANVKQMMAMDDGLKSQ